MKPFRFALSAVCLAVYLFFPYRAVQFIAAAVFLSIFISFLYSRILREGLTAGRHIHSMKVARFDGLELVVTLENRSFLPAPACYLSDAPGTLSVSADDGRWIQALAPHERITLRYTVASSQRGEYTVGPLRVSSGDPLGLFPFEKTLDSYCTVLVCPAPVELSLAFDSGIPQGAIALHDPRYEDVTLFRSVRDYSNGDELKRINWKSSARFGKLFTNQYQDSLNSPVFVFLDLSLCAYPLRFRSDTVESAIACVAAIVSRAGALRQQCGFASTGVIPGGLSHPDPSSAPFLRAASSQEDLILDILARITQADGNPEADRDLLGRSLCTLPSGGRFFYVGPASPDRFGVSGYQISRIGEYMHEIRK
jgi:uncharacterized protein (DUF58 family)